jgi:AcrR family transcriptional regulator
VEIRPGLRERKKAETRRALRVAAYELAVERGPDRVTVADIADAANVSVRTFFNYYPSKESAIVGIDSVLVEVARQRLLGRPASESPFDALRHVFTPDENTDVSDLADSQATRVRLVLAHPGLKDAQLAGLAELSRVLTEAVAQRVGLDPSDLYAATLVSSMISAFHLVLSRWEANDRTRPLREELDEAFGMIGRGFTSMQVLNRSF